MACLRAHSAIQPSSCEDGERLVAPQELGKGEDVLVRILRGSADLSELNSPIVVCRSEKHPPPVRQEREGVIVVFLGDNQRGEVEDAGVDVDLCGQATKRVALALQLVPGHAAVDDCYVHPHLLAESKLVEDEGRVVPGVLVRESAMESIADVDVSHRGASGTAGRVADRLPRRAVKDKAPRPGGEPEAVA